MKYVFYLVIVFFCSNPLYIFSQPKKINTTPNKLGIVKIIFKNTIRQAAVVLDDSVYSNPFGENYTIAKLKYYVGNTSLIAASKIIADKIEYHLINQSIESTQAYSFAAPQSKYDSIRFLLGVDSASNTSGAQAGALDPLQDMFWTWNTGYIMFKLEGNSPQSNVINNKIEYHIGGYRGENMVTRYITLPFPEGQFLQLQEGKTGYIFIEADIDKFWQGQQTIKITETPVCSSPGKLANKIAQNYSTIFKVVAIKNAE
jgi:hypothetical protein